MRRIHAPLSSARAFATVTSEEDDSEWQGFLTCGWCRDDPLTVAGPRGICTHFPLSAGGASSWPASIAPAKKPGGGPSGENRSAASPGEGGNGCEI